MVEYHQPFLRVLAGDGAAAEEIAFFIELHVAHQAAPQKEEDTPVAVVAGDAGAPDFDALLLDGGGEGGEVEFAGGIKAATHAGHFQGLHAVGADDLAGVVVADEQVMEGGVEGVQVALGDLGGFESLAKFQIKDLVAEAEDFVEFARILGEGDGVAAGGVVPRGDALGVDGVGEVEGDHGSG